MSLKALFSQLNEWRDRSKKDPKSCDSLAIISLQIVASLLNSNKEAQIIAKNLSLVLDDFQEEDVAEQLSLSMALADGALEENLRGFSSLLKLVLSEHRVSRNPEVKLLEIEGIDQGIIDSFDQLSLMLEAYFDLSEAFSIKTPKATTIMLLRTLATIYDVFHWPEVVGASIVFGWLKDRVKNDEIAKLYLSWQTMKDFRECSLELLVLAICSKSARGEAVSAEEMPMLDRSLSLAGMLGLRPLVDSGFLSLEDAPIGENRTGVKILKF